MALDSSLWNIVSALRRGETIPQRVTCGSMQSSLHCATLLELAGDETQFRHEVNTNTSLRHWAEDLDDEQLTYLLNQNG